ncbi:MAG: substrate-binding domain-containing protein [Chloroflexota bacterium]
MRQHRFLSLLIALSVALSLLLVGRNGVSARSNSATLHGTIRIGQITSITGPFSVYGTMEVAGFKLGLRYATNGTYKVDGARIQTFQYSDASGAAGLPDPATAVTQAKAAITNDHVQILQCCASSASALAVAGVAAQYKKILMAAPAATDGLSGINRYTFRTSREDSQDAITGAKYAYHKFGHTYMTLGQDYAFGHGQVDSWKAQLNKLHATDAGDVFFPLTATDFTPYIQQILAKNPQWLFIPCAGAQCVGLFKQLADQGLLDKIKVMTGLPNNAAIPSFGSAGTKMGFISVYYYKFPHTKANTYLIKEMRAVYHRVPDIFDQDAFAAAQQIVAAIKKAHSTNTNKLIHALEGQTIQGPKGAYTIRKQDHVCLQPMYVTKLVGSGLKPVLLATKSPKSVAPAIQAHSW